MLQYDIQQSLRRAHLANQANARRICKLEVKVERQWRIAKRFALVVTVAVVLLAVL